MKVLVVSLNDPVGLETYVSIAKNDKVTVRSYFDFYEIIDKETYDLVILEDNPKADWLPVQDTIKELLKRGYKPQQIVLVLPSLYLID